ncbi:MAG: tetratricopeptide repeat protein [Acidobacteria bacterium]|nr:tetratricopeptide repeat protein [Acidobacteriota bacterium]
MGAVIALAWFALQAAQDPALRLAAQAMEARDYPTAIRHFQTALKANPRNTKILSSLGLCLAGAGKFDEAARQFQTLVKLEPGVAAHYYNLGLAFLNANANMDAENAFRKTLSLAPRHARAKVQLGNALLGQARGGDTSKMQAASEAYHAALPENPRDPELRFNYAFTLARTGDEEAALRQYREVVRLAPAIPQGHFFLGVTLFQVGNWDEALSSLKAAAARGLDDFGLHYYLGSALLRTLDREGARKHLEAAVQRDPEHPGVHFQLSAMYRALGDKEKAASEQRLFRELTASQESRWRAETLERAAGRAIRQGDLAQGISALEQAFEARPDAALARNLALAHLQQGAVEKARALLGKSLAMAPDDAATHNYLGLLAAREGGLAQASRHFEKAAALDPNLADALFNAGVAAFESKRYDVAVQRFKTALEKSNEPRIREALALALADAGRHEESQREFEAAQRQRAGGSR